MFGYKLIKPNQSDDLMSNIIFYYEIFDQIWSGTLHFVLGLFVLNITKW